MCGIHLTRVRKGWETTPREGLASPAYDTFKSARVRTEEGKTRRDEARRERGKIHTIASTVLKYIHRSVIHPQFTIHNTQVSPHVLASHLPPNLDMHLHLYTSTPHAPHLLISSPLISYPISISIPCPFHTYLQLTSVMYKSLAEKKRKEKKKVNKHPLPTLPFPQAPCF